MNQPSDYPSERTPRPLSRRNFFAELGTGLGTIALAWLLEQEGARQARGGERLMAAAPGLGAPHYAPRAKRVIQIFCAGGVSHVDTFDYKPELERNDGKEMTGKGKVDTFFGKPGRLMKSRFAFHRRGQCGRWVSDLLPHLAGHVDDLTFIYSTVAQSSNHTPATFQMNSGFTMNGFPCLGAWLSYGLGTENQDLPAFVVLPDPRGLPAGGSINWTAGFLPASHQGVAFRTARESLGDRWRSTLERLREGSAASTRGLEPIADLYTPPGVSARERAAGLDLLRQMNQEFLESTPGDSVLAARIRAYELAARMQVSVPEAVGIEQETQATHRLYGLDEAETAGFGRNCLMARRLLERGVRFVQLIHGGAFGSPRINWDAHENVVENHTQQAVSLDKPVSGLLADLKARGMLDDTLLLWTTEFGRTPITQGVGAPGRDHHPHCFTIWMAGAGLRPGMALGSSDEVGYFAGEDPVSIYDFHATVLHLLGLDHRRLTFYHNGIERRLTDVHGEVVTPILA